MEATIIYKQNEVTREHDCLPSDWMSFFPDLKKDRLEIVKRIAGNEFHDHRLEGGYSYSATDKSKFYLSVLLANVGVSDSYLKRKNTAKEIATGLWKKYFDPELKQGTTIRRVDDVIAISYKTSSRSYWRRDQLYIYDTKLKTRKLLNKIDGVIANNLLTDSSIREFNSNIREGRQCTICGDLTTILNGTTCGWIIQNYQNKTLPNLEAAKLAPVYQNSAWDAEDRKYHTETNSLTKWVEALINYTAIADDEFKNIRTLFTILMKEKLLLEQLAKCGLWNLLSMFIITDDITPFGSAAAKYCDACIGYNPNSKSLTGSFGLRMDQIRRINDILAPTSTDKKHRPELNLIGAMTGLGLTLKDLKALDNKTFEKVLWVSLGTHAIDYSGSNRQSIARYLCNNYRSESIKKLLANLETVNRKVAFLEKYLSDDEESSTERLWENLDDYLKMRESLYNLLRQGAAMHIQNDIEELKTFDKDWPALPDGGTIFLRYYPGMRIRTYQYSYGREGSLYSETEFKSYVSRNYPAEDIAWAADAEGGLTGAVLKLTATGNVRRLHDEISVWLDTKRNKETAQRFAKASEIAKKMEYISKDYGLRIVAPVAPQELKEEGRVLHHCVGGYVDSVCQGNEYILFIRRNEMPKEPYFTLDITPSGEVRQVHCYQNLNPTSADIKEAYARSGSKVYAEDRDVLGFLMEWATKVKGVKASSVKKQYGCLCAIR